MLLMLLLACGPGPPPYGEVPPNVMLIVVDDIGRDLIAAYGDHPDPPATPNLDALAAQGMLFRRAYAAPSCSPTRVAMLTGTYGFRLGIGSPIFRWMDFGLSTGADSLPKLLDRETDRLYDHAAVGKWHMGPAGEPDHPRDMGFHSHAGSLQNLAGPVDGENQGYFHWSKTTDGRSRFTDVYATTDTTNDAVDRVGAMREPWFLWVAYNAAHAPWHVPPEHLHDRDLTDSSPTREKVAATVEALDTEIGRLLDEVDLERTVVIFLGDNGTASEMMDPPGALLGKGHVYDGGVRVPFVVAGPGVAQGETSSLVNVSDVFATVADLAGVPSDAPDSVSFLPVLQDPGAVTREWAYAEHFTPNGWGPYEVHDRMVTDERYKLVSRLDGTTELYDLHADPGEQTDLVDDPAAADALARLESILDAL